MPLITFLSDFGHKEQYVALVKLAIYNQLPNQKILDISHNVKMGNIVQASYLLQSVIPDCPEETIHLVAVGTTLAAEQLLVKYKNQYFIGPNNGIFPLCFGDSFNDIKVFEIGTTKQISFPSKEIYAQWAVSIINKTIPSLEEATNVIRKIGRQPVKQQNVLTGHIIYVEAYGNLIVNITKDTFSSFTHNSIFEIFFEYESIKRISNNYHDADFGDCLVFFNSNGFMEIAINHGNAAELLGMKYGSLVKVIVRE